MTAGILSRLPLLAKWSGRMIQIKTPQEIELMRASGLVTAGAIAAVKAAVRPGVSTGVLDASFATGVGAVVFSELGCRSGESGGTWSNRSDGGILADAGGRNTF